MGLTGACGKGGGANAGVVARGTVGVGTDTNGVRVYEGAIRTGGSDVGDSGRKGVGNKLGLMWRRALRQR